MTFRCPRGWGFVFLAALLAAPITTIGPAPVHAASRSGIHRTTARASAASGRRHVRRHRRAAPPGGVYARHAVVLDPSTGQVLYEKNAERSVPIASISKLMTAMVFLELHPDLDRVVEVTRPDVAGAGHTQLRVREHVRLRNLLHMSLMISDNAATRVLARESGLPPEEFLARMNRKALEIGLTHTRFVEVTGLDERNVATATDVARLLQAAAEHELIHEITTTRRYAFTSASRRNHVFGNTNRLLYGRYEIVGGKTGFISAAGYCFATQLRTQGRELIAVVLGAPTSATRFADVVRLVNRTLTASIAPTDD